MCGTIVQEGLVKGSREPDVCDSSWKVSQSEKGVKGYVLVKCHLFILSSSIHSVNGYVF